MFRFTNPGSVYLVGYIGWIVGLLFLVPMSNLLPGQVRHLHILEVDFSYVEAQAEKKKQRYRRVGSASC